MKTTLATLMAFACIACASAQSPAAVQSTPASTASAPQSPAAVTALATPSPVIVTTAPAAGGCCRIVAETAVVVAFAEPLDTAKLQPGDFFALRLAEPVRLDGGVVIPEGTTGVGQVVDAAHARAGGAPAKLVLAARHLDYAGQQFKLHALKISASGKDNSKIAMGLSFGVGVLAMFVHGGEIQIPAGTLATARLAPNDPQATASAPSIPAASIAPAAALPQTATIPQQEH